MAGAGEWDTGGWGLGAGGWGLGAGGWGLGTGDWDDCKSRTAWVVFSGRQRLDTAATHCFTASIDRVTHRVGLAEAPVAAPDAAVVDSRCGRSRCRVGLRSEWRRGLLGGAGADSRRVVGGSSFRLGARSRMVGCGVSYAGDVAENTLHLTVFSHINHHKSTRAYHFVPKLLTRHPSVER